MSGYRTFVAPIRVGFIWSVFYLDNVVERGLAKTRELAEARATNAVYRHHRHNKRKATQ